MLLVGFAKSFAMEFERRGLSPHQVLLNALIRAQHAAGVDDKF